MKFTRTIVMFSSILALTSACSKGGKSANGSQLPGAVGKVTTTTLSGPTLTVTTENDQRTAQLTFPIGDKQSINFKGQLQDGGHDSLLKSDLEGDPSTVNAVVYGPASEVIIAVRQTPTDAQGEVSTAFVFVKATDGDTYSFYKREDAATLSTVKAEYDKLLSDAGQFQTWYNKALEEVKAQAQATPPSTQSPAPAPAKVDSSQPSQPATPAAPSTEPLPVQGDGQ